MKRSFSPLADAVDFGQRRGCVGCGMLRPSHQFGLRSKSSSKSWWTTGHSNAIPSCLRDSRSTTHESAEKPLPVRGTTTALCGKRKMDSGIGMREKLFSNIHWLIGVFVVIRLHVMELIPLLIHSFISKSDPSIPHLPICKTCTLYSRKQMRRKWTCRWTYVWNEIEC